MLRRHSRKNTAPLVCFEHPKGDMLIPSRLLDQDTFEMQSGIVLPGHNVIVIDDLIATGKELLTDIVDTYIEKGFSH